MWTLIVIMTVKYVSFAMCLDNDGEVSILALMVLLGAKSERRRDAQQRDIAECLLELTAD